MSEIRTMNTVVNRIYSVDQINRSLRATAREVAETLGHSLGITGTTPSNGVVMGGLEASGASGAMYTQITRGTALLPAARALPLGNALYCYLADDETSNPAALLHADGDATNPRYDAVTIKPLTQTDTLENASTYPTGAVTPQVNIQRGCAVTFNVIAGTPAGSPGFPSVPSDELVLSYVLVPAGLTAGGGGMASATYEDWRRIANPKAVQNNGSLSVSSVAQDFDAVVANNLGVNFPTAIPARSLSWYMDGGEAWWAARRVNPPAGDTTANLYPMMVPGGREWDIFVPFSGAGIQQTVNNNDMTFDDLGYQVQVTRSGTTGQEQFALRKAVPVAARGLELTAAVVSYDVDTAFDGTVTAQALALAQLDAAGSPTTLDSVAMTLGSAGARQDVALSIPANTVIATGEALRLVASIDLDATGTQGVVQLLGVKLTFREGRA